MSIESAEGLRLRILAALLRADAYVSPDDLAELLGEIGVTADMMDALHALRRKGFVQRRARGTPLYPRYSYHYCEDRRAEIADLLSRVSAEPSVPVKPTAKQLRRQARLERQSVDQRFNRLGIDDPRRPLFVAYYRQQMSYADLVDALASYSEHES